MATQDECKKEILRLWAGTPKSNPPTYAEKQGFYMDIEFNQADLLLFRVKKGVDKWQVVHAWLNGIK